MASKLFRMFSCRHYSVGAQMSAWHIEQFCAPLALKQTSIPELTAPDQVLIKVKASSVNPLDIVMRTGYGNTILSTRKQLESCSMEPVNRLPIIPGRDCSGEIVEIGGNVRDFKVGDEVMAVIPAHWQGAHAEYVVTSYDCIAPKPNNATHVEATAMPFVACTSWSALVTFARMIPNNVSGQRVLIHGGSGGIGSAAIQMLRAWGCEKVVATCPADCKAFIRQLGAEPVDYNSPTVKEEIIAHAPFDVILDCVDTELSRWSDNVLGVWRNCVHVSIVSPLLHDTDRYGMLFGLASTALKSIARVYEPLSRGRIFTYAFFMPHSECLQQISRFIEEGKIKPIVEKVFPFAELPESYDKVAKLSGVGKTVIDFSLKKEDQL